MTKLGKISLVLPVYNEVAILQKVLDKYLADIEKLECKYEIICVNDGCSDGSEDVLTSNAKRNRNIRVINLDGRYGKQAALVAGMDATDRESDVVMLADVDILNPIGIIENIARKIENGEKIVYAKRENIGFDKFKETSSNLTVKLAAKVFGIDGFYTGKSNIVAFARPVADVLIALPDKNKFMRVMDNWLGWEIHYISYISGFTKYEEKNIIASSMKIAYDTPKLRGSKSMYRDKIREHTQSIDLMWGFLIGAIIMLGTGIFFNVHVDIGLWAHLIAWAGFAVMTVMTAVFYLQAVIVKRIGKIGKHAVFYNVRNIIN